MGGRRDRTSGHPEALAVARPSKGISQPRALGQPGAVAFRPVAPGLRLVPRSATICTLVTFNYSIVGKGSDNIRKYAREFKKDVHGISRGALPALSGYDWPGNVRELENVIARSVALATRPVIRLDDLPLDLSIHETGTRGGDAGPGVLTLKEARDRFEHAYVLRALERENWNQSRAARSLGVHRNTLLARLAGWGIRRDDGTDPLASAAGQERA